MNEATLFSISWPTVRWVLGNLALSSGIAFLVYHHFIKPKKKSK